MSTKVKCQKCGDQFNSQQELDLHSQKMHSKKEEQEEQHSMLCLKCGIKTKTVGEVEQHI